MSATGQHTASPSQDHFDKEARETFAEIQEELMSLTRSCQEKGLASVIPVLQEHHDNLSFKSGRRSTKEAAPRKQPVAEDQVALASFRNQWASYQKKASGELIRLARRGVSQQAWGAAGMAIVAAQFVSDFDETVFSFACRITRP